MVTDKELLTFSNLAKLQCQFSNYELKYTDKNSKDEKIEYTTIRKLISKEISGQGVNRTNSKITDKIEENNKSKRDLEQKRLKIEENKKNLESEKNDLVHWKEKRKDYRITEEQYRKHISNYEASLDAHKSNIDKYKQDEIKYREITFPQYKDELKKIIEEVNAGKFYRIHDDGSLKFLYNTEDDIREAAPMLMEYYDRTENSDGDFLDEWEVVYAGDSYDMSEYLYKRLKDTGIPIFNLGITPTRDIVEKAKDSMYTQRMVSSGITIFVNLAIRTGGDALGKALGKFVTRNMANYTNYLEISTKENGVIVTKLYKLRYELWDKIYKKTAQEILEVFVKEKAYAVEKGVKSLAMQTLIQGNGGTVKKVLEMLIETSETLKISVLAYRTVEGIFDLNTLFDFQGNPITILSEKIADVTKNEILEKLINTPQEYKFLFSLNGLNIVLLRKNSKEGSAEYVLVVEDTKKLERIQKNFNVGKIPEENWFLSEFLEGKKEEFTKKFGENFSPILTGLGNAGDVATIVGIINYKDSFVRCFYGNKPIEVSAAPFFSAPDINNYMKEKTFFSWEEYCGVKYEDDPKMESTQIINYALSVYFQAEVLARSIPIGAAILLVQTIIPILIKWIKVKELKNLIEALRANGIIKNDSKYIGRINKEKIKETLPYKFNDGTTLDLNLESYIQMLIYTEIGIAGLISGFNTNYKKIGNLIIFETGEQEIKEGAFSQSTRVELNIKGSSLTAHRYIVTRSKFDNNREIVIPHDTEIETIGKILEKALRAYVSIQDNFDSLKLDSYYLEDNVPKKITELKSLQEEAVECETSKKIPQIQAMPEYKKYPPKKRISEYNYFPFITNSGDIIKGETPAKLREEYIGSFLRSIYPDKGIYGNEHGKYRPNGKYFSLKKELIIIDDDCEYIGSREKGDVVNQYLLERIEYMVKGLKEDTLNLEYPHAKEVIKEIKKNKKILEKFYEIVPNTEHQGNLLVGHITDKKFNEKTLTYSYNVSDKILSRAISILLYYDKTSEGMGTVETTIVLDGAPLICNKRNGSGLIKFAVTSQNSRKVNGRNIATVADSKKGTNINGLFVSCSVNKGEVCSNHMQLIQSEWQGGSKGETIEGHTLLLNSNSIKCIHGGEITVAEKIIGKKNS